MSKFEESKFLKSIFSSLRCCEKENKNEAKKYIFNERLKEKKRIWKKEYNPLRSIILWGYDENNNPSFLILYGKHEYKSTESNIDSTSNILEDNVKYTSYALFKGKEGHLPAFQSVKIMEEYSSYYSEKKSQPEMYYKTGIQGYWFKDEDYKVNEFKNLYGEEQIEIPYFSANLYEDYANIVEEKNIKFDNFTLVKHPNEILKLDNNLNIFYPVIYSILCDKNLYIRKKSLIELIELNPPREIYDLLSKLGSTELVSGLFLELGKRKNNVLLEEAKSILEKGINWAEESYSSGVKRCAKIYISALDSKLKAERIDEIKKTLPDMDLHLINIKNKVILEGKILEGSLYRKYALQFLLNEFDGRYDYEQRKWVQFRRPERYKISLYSDGVVLNALEIKNTIQEAEIYGLADVIGKIAYYLDAPRLTYYFKGNSKTKELKYYKRYVKRLINSYAENDPNKYIEAMKALLTSYTEYDYVCKFKGNFQFNEILKYYLYYDFKEKAPYGWENWHARYEWMENDQLMKLKGRYEYKKEIWDEHLHDVLEIAAKANIDTVLKACYYILKESEKTTDLIEEMTFKELVSLTEGSYEPLANIFKDELNKKLSSINVFNSEIMLLLMSSKSEENHKVAIEFLEKTEGKFSPNDLANLMLLDNINLWTGVFKESLFSLNSNEYCNYVKSIINNSLKFIDSSISLSKEIKDILSLSTNKIKDISEDEKAYFISTMILEVLSVGKISDWIEDFIEEAIFSISYEDLEKILKMITIDSKNARISEKSRQVLSVLESIKNNSIPSDSEIISILETGSSKMINILAGIFMANTEELRERNSTLLIMFESDITLLNKKSEEIFNNMEADKRRELHKIFIDSPVNKVYSFGLKKLYEIYGDIIPSEFILQMLEHTSSDVKAYISGKTDEILNNLGNGDKELFMYYFKTLILLPNRVSKSKDNLYRAIPKFALKYSDKVEEIENILLDIGGSNIIMDSERALVALAKIRKEAALIEG